MPEPISEDLQLEISSALQSIGQLDDALQQVVSTFAVGLATALESVVSAGADVAPLADSLDVAGLGPAVETALSDATAAPLDVTVEGDTAPLTDAIDGAAAVSPVVDVQADVAEASTAIDSLSGQTIDVGVDVDTSQAQDAIDALGKSATGAAGGTGGDGSGFGGLEGAVLGFEAAASGAEGSAAGLTGAVGSLGPELKAAAAAGTLFVGFLGTTVALAADAEAQQKRFNDTFGASAAIVEHIDVGGLNISLEELGKTSGTTRADLESSATRIGLIGQAAGAAKPEVAETTSNILGLAGAIAVSNPRFGTAAVVADTLSRALSTGRTRSLIPYGISLTQAQIQQEAFNETGKTSADQLTAFDKIVAGTTLALRQQGDTLGGRYAEGAKNAEIQLRALKVQLEETLISIGTPLLQPTVDTFTALLPVAQELGIVLGKTGEALVPLVESLLPFLEDATGLLGGLADGISLVAKANNSIGGVGFISGIETLVPGASAIHSFGNILRGFHDDSKKAEEDFRGLGTQIEAAAQSSSGLGSLSGAVDELAKHFDPASQAAKAFNNELIALAASGKADDAEKVIGLITIELEKQGKSASEIGALFRPYFEALDLTAAKNKVAATAIQQAGVTATASAGGFLQLADAIAAGKISSDDASAVATQLGISTAAATSFIDAQTAAISAAKDKQIEATAAAQQLRSELQLGTITTQQAQAGFADLGITVGGIGAFLSDAESEVTTFVSTVEAGLPKASAAFKDLDAASDPTQLAQNLQAQTDQINTFLLTIEILRSQGRERLATFFAEQGVGSLAQAAQAAGDSAVAATDATALRLNEAARSKAEQLGIELVAGASTQGTAAGGALVSGAAGAIDADTSAPSAARRKGDETGKAFKPDIKASATEAVTAAATALPTLSNLPNQAGLLGVATGEAFAHGMANGLSNPSDVAGVSAAAGALASTADAAVRRRLGITSPSKVGIELGQQFAQGLGIGIVDATPETASASAALAASVIKQLQDALAAATSQSSAVVQSATSQAFSTFISGAVSSLPSLGSDISAFGSNLTGALSSQASALEGLHKANQTYAADQARVARLTRETAAAFGEFARTGTKEAQQAFEELARRLAAAKDRIKADLGEINAAARAAGQANRALDAATDPATFTRNLRAQTAAANQFARDIAKLSREGFTDLAKQLADAGPEAAGALARGFAKSPAKAKAAEAAVDAAQTFSDNYQKELTRLFGPQGGAAQAATTAGQSIGQALTTGLQVSSQAGTAAALANLNQQIAAGIPQVLPLVTTPTPQKALTPVSANAPTIIQTPTLAGFAGTQTLELDLTIVLDDGRTVAAKTSVPFTPPRDRSLKQLVRAQVQAS